MKKTAFTLIEVLISIVLLGLIFTFLFSTINSVKKQSKPYIEKAKKLTYQKKVYALLNIDLAEALTKPSVSIGQHYDVISFQTKQSLYEIAQPYVTYFVSKKENALVRIESMKPFAFDSKLDLKKMLLFGDILAKNVQSFKVSLEGAKITVLLRTQKYDPILLSVAMIAGK